MQEKRSFSLMEEKERKEEGHPPRQVSPDPELHVGATLAEGNKVRLVFVQRKNGQKCFTLYVSQHSSPCLRCSWIFLVMDVGY